MTPLAHRIAKELTLPLKDRTFDDRCGLLGQMDDIHCFEVTECLGLARELAKQMPSKGVPIEASFLPAEKTWIEMEGYLNGEKARTGFLLTDEDAVCADFSALHFGANKWFLDPRSLPRECDQEFTNAVLLALLAIINSPRLIGRRQHMPHRGLEKKLASAKGLSGKFPLHAWTELKLSASDIGKHADGSAYEAHYTGEKCLHFCRAHLRVQGGKLVKVRAHWRGNAALGIKQTRYRLAA